MKIVLIALLALFFLALAYVVCRLWRIVPGGWPAKLGVTGLFLLWFVPMALGFRFTELFPLKLAGLIYQVGHPWAIAFLYLLLFFVLADIACAFRLLPKRFLDSSLAGFGTIFALIAALMIGGSLHYKHKYREELTITTEKPLEKPLTVVLASDLHVGYHNRREELARWIDLINRENPDLVLFGGDIVDRSLRPVLAGDYAAEFRRIQAPVLAIPGNHEYYCDMEGSKQFFATAGIRLLRDSVCTCQGITIIGRDDRNNPQRKSLAALADSLQGFTILLDHQPFNLEEAEEAGIDFQFSGHTHHGQVWPISWFTDAMYEKAWGHHTRGNTRYYVSSGLGIWGAKIRIGTRSEYLVLHIKEE